MSAGDTHLRGALLSPCFYRPKAWCSLQLCLEQSTGPLPLATYSSVPTCLFHFEIFNQVPNILTASAPSRSVLSVPPPSFGNRHLTVHSVGSGLSFT